MNLKNDIDNIDLSNENVVHVKKDGVEFLQFRKLLEYKNIVNHAYTLGTNVNYRVIKPNKEPLPKEDYDKNIKDYMKMSKAIGEDYTKIVLPKQDHTRNIKIANKKIKSDAPDFNLSEYEATDGLITNKKNMILATTNADCILLLFFDPIKKVIANVHSGWKGTLQRISVNCVRKMQNEFGCKPEDILCFICPSIRKCHFEVNKDVKDMFLNEFKDLGNIDDIIEKQNIIQSEEELKNQENIKSEEQNIKKDEEEKWNIDTVLINQIILKKEGLKEENIIDCGICSVCNSNKIHSFRVEKENYGLATALITLKRLICCQRGQTPLADLLDHLKC